jgi:hypothetical protein
MRWARRRCDGGDCFFGVLFCFLSCFPSCFLSCFLSQFFLTFRSKVLMKGGGYVTGAVLTPTLG